MVHLLMIYWVVCAICLIFYIRKIGLYDALDDSGERTPIIWMAICIGIMSLMALLNQYFGWWEYELQQISFQNLGEYLALSTFPIFGIAVLMAIIVFSLAGIGAALVGFIGFWLSPFFLVFDSP